MSLDGAGGVRYWGFSPATDLTPEIPDSAKADDGPLRFLGIAISDVRHLLKTLAAAARQTQESGKPSRTFEFAVYEREPEILARHILLLAVALDYELPRRERAEVLLEVWANCLLREKTAAYVAVKAVQIGRAISHDEGPLAPLIDISSLKSRDRDALEAVLRTWAEDVEFDVVKLRDERLRKYYGARYDARRNVLEWDYTMEWWRSPLLCIRSTLGSGGRPASLMRCVTPITRRRIGQWRRWRMVSRRAYPSCAAASGAMLSTALGSLQASSARTTRSGSRTKGAGCIINRRVISPIIIR